MSDRANGAGGSDDVVARAIKELIDSVPGEEEAPPPEAETSTVQPWAETASPSASDKRPLEALLGEYVARVEATPGAMARLPTEAHPSKTFFDRIGSTTVINPGCDHTRPHLVFIDLENPTELEHSIYGKKTVE